jgi:hypothetical protein
MAFLKWLKYSSFSLRFAVGFDLNVARIPDELFIYFPSIFFCIPTQYFRDVRIVCNQFSIRRSIFGRAESPIIRAIKTASYNDQLLDEVEQNIVICRWRADQLFADAEGRG